jgi:hypothetical protein
MKKIILLSAFILICNEGFTQNSKGQAVYDQIIKEVMAHAESKLLKDSIALYTFAFQIEVKKVKDSTLVTSITVNDSIANVIFPNYDFLRKQNYKPFISRAKRATLVIPFGLVLVNYSPNKIVDKSITVKGLADTINKIFNYNQKENTDTEHFIYLRPMVMYVDKAVYD